jgi:hypothetical protein
VLSHTHTHTHTHTHCLLLFHTHNHPPPPSPLPPPPSSSFPLSLSLSLSHSYHSVTLQRMVPATVDQSNYDCSLYISDRTVSGLLDQIISHERLDGSMVPQTHIQKDVCREQTIQGMTYESQTDGDISCKKEYASPHMVGLGLLLVNQNFSGQIYVEEIFPGFAAHKSGQFKVSARTHTHTSPAHTHTKMRIPS